MRPVSIVPWMLLLASPALSQEQMLEAGRQYAGGTRVSAPWTGVSFVVPDGFTGQYDPEAAAFLMMDVTRQGLVMGVYAFSEATVEATGDELSSILERQGIELVPRRAPEHLVHVSQKPALFLATL